MTDWQGVLLALTTVALVVMAAVQVMVFVTMARLAKQASDALESLQRDVKPLIEKVHRISDDAGRAAALAAAQAERVDRLMASAAARIDETLGVVQGAVIEPIRQGAALMAAVRAAVGVFRSASSRGRQSQDEDEALFVG